MEITSSPYFSTSSSSSTTIRKLVPISFDFPSLNWSQYFFLITTPWTHSTTTFLILPLIPYLVLSSIPPTYDFTSVPTAIFIWTCFESFLYLICVLTGDIMDILGVSSDWHYNQRLVIDKACCWNLVFCVIFSWKK